jgi:hypothetical protein
LPLLSPVVTIKALIFTFKLCSKTTWSHEWYMMQNWLIYKKNKEYIADPSLLTGGTQDQQCHADIQHLFNSIHDKTTKISANPDPDTKSSRRQSL